MSDIDTAGPVFEWFNYHVPFESTLQSQHVFYFWNHAGIGRQGRYEWDRDTKKSRKSLRVMSLCGSVFESIDIQEVQTKVIM